MSNPTIPLREQLESARAKLSSVTARFEALPLNKQICFGDLPQKVTSLLEARIIEQADKRLPAAAVKPAAPSPVPKPATAANLQSLGSTVAALATDPRKEVREPLIAGLQQSVAARLGLERPTCTREEFSELDMIQKRKFCAMGGQVVDPQPAPVKASKPSPGAKVVSYAQFNTFFDPAAKMAFIKNGGKIQD